MIPCHPLMTIYRDIPLLMLDGEILPDRTRSVPDERMSETKGGVLSEELLKQVLERFL